MSVFESGCSELSLYAQCTVVVYEQSILYDSELSDNTRSLNVAGLICSLTAQRSVVSAYIRCDHRHVHYCAE
jgi:hypothetical protein